MNEKDLLEHELKTFRNVPVESLVSYLSDIKLVKAKRIITDSKVVRTSRVISAVISHILLLIAVGEPFFFLKPPLNDQFEYTINILFKWHVCLSVLAVALFTEALWVFNSSLGLFPYLAPVSKFKVHLFIVLLTCSLCDGTWYFASYNHFLAGRPYYSTWHGLLSVCTVVYLMLHWVVGFSLLHDRLRTNFMMEVYVWSLVVILTSMALVVYTSMFSFWFTRTFTGLSWHLHFFILLGWYIYTLVTLLTIRNQVYITYV